MNNNILNKTEKEKAIKAYLHGDNYFLYVLNEILGNKKHLKKYNEIKSLLFVLEKMNYIIIATELNEHCFKYNFDVQNIYTKIKQDVFKLLNIKESEVE